MPLNRMHRIEPIKSIAKTVRCRDWLRKEYRYCKNCRQVRKFVKKKFPRRWECIACGQELENRR